MVGRGEERYIERGGRRYGICRISEMVKLGRRVSKDRDWQGHVLVYIL